jgi:hypothetical protein
MYFSFNNIVPSVLGLPSAHFPRCSSTKSDTALAITHVNISVNALVKQNEKSHYAHHKSPNIDQFLTKTS